LGDEFTAVKQAAGLPGPKVSLKSALQKTESL
jgi:hypothetical protein